MSPSTAPFPPTASTCSLSPDPSTTPLPVAHTTLDGKTKKTRTRNGCLTCRARKKRCDEQRPTCNGCSRLALSCQWEDPERAKVERREKREQRKRDKASQQQHQQQPEEQVASSYTRGTGVAGEGGEDLQGLEALATAGLISSMSSYSPAAPPAMTDSMIFEYSPHDRPVPLPVPSTSIDTTQSPWTGFLGSFAPGPSDVGWTTSFPQLVAPATPQIEQASLVSQADPDERERQQQNSHVHPHQLSDVDITSWLSHGDLPLTFSSLVRSRSPSPARPFDPDLSALFPSFGDFEVLNLPPGALDQFSLHQPNQAQAHSQALVAQQSPLTGNQRELALPPPSPTSSTSTTKRFPKAVTRAASFLASSDFAFTQAYLLSHYTTSLAQHVSIASSVSSNPSSPASPQSRSTRNSTSASANLFLSLIPHAHRNPFLMHSILSWSSANLAAASSTTPPSSATGERQATAGNQSAMGSLSDELGALAEGLLEDVIPKLDRRNRVSSQGRENTERGRPNNRAESPEGKQRDGYENIEFEPVLAGVLMLCQAAICRGDVEKWRERLRQAAQVIDLAGGLSECRSPLARQLVRNLLYHDVLSSSSSKHGLLLDYSSLKPPTNEGATPASSKNSTVDTGREHGDEAYDDAEDEEVLDTLMGIAEPVFLLIGRITSLAREKHEAAKRSSGMIREEELSTFLRKVDDVRGELELEKARIDSFVVDRPDLEPHRYFHEVFRLCGLLYLQMVCEMPPRSLPVLLLVRKMLNLFEVIVNEKLPGLCSCHFALYVLHLNSTPLTSPHSQLNDRQRSARVFDHHMEAFAFLNTKRSRALVDEAWRRSNDGRLFVDPDAILEEWKWSLNWA